MRSLAKGLPIEGAVRVNPGWRENAWDGWAVLGMLRASFPHNAAHPGGGDSEPANEPLRRKRSRDWRDDAPSRCSTEGPVR
jgi:hypothetical protein